MQIQVFKRTVRLTRKQGVCLAAGLAVLLFFIWLLWPMGSVFVPHYSQLVYDCQGELLRVFLAPDQQLRFPADTTALPHKYVTAVLTCEDKRFRYHPGVDPLALANAIRANLKRGQRVRGGSTITMQVARLARPKKRTYFNKLRECFYAVKLTLHFSKPEILKLYSGHVPMGGNIVGVQAASYCYFGKPLKHITWSEAALLTVLPNSPSYINLATKRVLLKNKRNALLKKLLAKGIIDKVTCSLSCSEPLPPAKRFLPFEALHFTRYAASRYQRIRRVNSSLDLQLQHKVVAEAERMHRHLHNLGIYNLAVVVAETQTGLVRAYLGSNDYYDSRHAGQVDGVHAARSTGSLLKPFLVAKALDKGPFTMSSVVQDVPTFFGTFAPHNATKTFSGVAPLSQVLIRSLNVPAVRLLNTYGVADFYDFLKSAGVASLFRTPEGYGLTLILGGAEASLWELTRLYLCLANQGKKMDLLISPPGPERSQGKKSEPLITPGGTWLTLRELTRLTRPGADLYWHLFNQNVPVAWKTGTSYGQKDGWAVGVNRQWTIGVWVGNFSGLGNASLSGARSAAPLLFALFNLLTRHDEPKWFEEPYTDLEEVYCCRASGFPVGPYCPDSVVCFRPRSSYMPGTCPFHRRYLIDRKTKKSVCSLCWQSADTAWVTKLIYPPQVVDVLNIAGQSVDAIPLHCGKCPTFQDFNRLTLVYPVNGIKIFVPRDYDGTYEKIVFSAKHQRPASHLFWYLNGSFIRETVDNHQFAYALEPGRYKLTVQDEEGFTRTVSFRAYKKEKKTH